MQYPVNFEYDKHSGSMFDGMAATAEEARAISAALLTEANDEPTESPIMYLATTEAGPKGTREQIQKWWAQEIEEGWTRPIQVYGGFIAQIEYWCAA